MAIFNPLKVSLVLSLLCPTLSFESLTLAGHWLFERRLAQREEVPTEHLEEVEDQEIGTRRPQCDWAKVNINYK